MKAKRTAAAMIERHLEMARVIENPVVAAERFRRIEAIAGFVARMLEMEAKKQTAAHERAAVAVERLGNWRRIRSERKEVA